MDIHDRAKPAAGERLVWQHSGDGLVKPPKTLNQKQRKIRRIVSGRVSLVFQVVVFATFLYLYDVKILFFSGLANGLKGTAIVSIVIFLVLQSFKKYKFRDQQDTDGVPLWMSRDRIMFNPTYPHEAFEVRLRDIKSVNKDFVAGSPAIALQLANKTVNLISSEATKLLKHLYMLRPDLEPTS